jgi:hypothetical protein
MMNHQVLCQEIKAEIEKRRENKMYIQDRNKHSDLLERLHPELLKRYREKYGHLDTNLGVGDRNMMNMYLFIMTMLYVPFFILLYYVCRAVFFTFDYTQNKINELEKLYEKKNVVPQNLKKNKLYKIPPRKFFGKPKKIRRKLFHRMK